MRNSTHTLVIGILLGMALAEWVRVPQARQEGRAEVIAKLREGAAEAARIFASGLAGRNLPGPWDPTKVERDLRDMGRRLGETSKELKASWDRSQEQFERLRVPGEALVEGKRGP